MRKYKGMIAHPATAVRRRLARISFPEMRFKIVPGWVEDLARTGNLPEKVCFAYVDLDLYIPIKTVLSLLDSRLPPRACVVIDDYGFFSAGAQTAVDEFVADTSKVTVWSFRWGLAKNRIASRSCASSEGTWGGSVALNLFAL